uniref:Kelch-like protein diablo n=1 Tax=Culicoides sonorensis TaxID=179676 RepID=A0A336K738_CULSO
MFNEEEEVYDTNIKACISHESMRQLYEMRNNNLLCDAVIKLQDNTNFNIHRNILSACSSFFRVLFTTTLNKSSNNEAAGDSGIVIKGIRSPIMHQIINYAYLRDCEIDQENIYELFTCADYCGITGLIQRCIDFLRQMLVPTNCINIMLFGKALSCEKLYQNSKLYVLRNFSKIAKESNEIIQLQFEEFKNIIDDEHLNVKDEETVWNCCLRWIDHDPTNRQIYVPQLLKAVRLGLLNTNFFIERVKDNPYVINNEEAKPIIIETLTFLYDLDIMNSNSSEVKTPDLAMPRLPHEVIFAIGGWSEGAPQSYIETYDTRADRWVRLLNEDPAGPRAYHGTAVIGFKIYCIGGFDGVEYFNTCRCFDAVKKQWKEIAPMHCKRCYVSVATFDNFIYAMGGYDGSNRQNTVERYNIHTNQWSMITPMNAQRSDASACCLNGKIYITGGFNGQECLNTAEVFNPETNMWTMLPTMLQRRSGVSCVEHKGKIYVIGGFNGLSRMNSGEKYDPETHSWSSIREMYHSRSNFGLEIIDDMIFAIGGFNGVATISHAECYVPETNEWLEATDMSIIRSALTANVVYGLPNVRDYIHKNREKLMEERRQRIFGNNEQYFDLDEPNEEE